MPSKRSGNGAAGSEGPPPPPHPIEAKLDAILTQLEQLNRRDRLRTWGGFLRSLIPLAILVGSVWYVYEYGDNLLEHLARTAAEQAARMTEQSSRGIVEQFQQFFPPSTTPR